MWAWRHPLTWIVLVHGALGLSFGLATPIFEAPDEAQHFLFVRYLQLHGNLPVQTLDQEGPRAHHPPLYFVVGAFVSAWVPEAGNADRVQPPFSGNFWFRYGDQSNDHKSKHLRTDMERWPYRGQALAAHVIRLLSLSFSLIAVVFTYLAARELLPQTGAALAAAWLAFNPMVLFMSGVVQNSTAALASSAVLICLLARWTRLGLTPARCAGLGLCLSAAILLQTSGLTLAAPIGLALLYDAWRMRDWRRFSLNALAVGLPVTVLTSWWFIRNQQLYGDWTANAIVGQLWSDQPSMPVEQVLHLLLSGMVGRFGYGLIIEYADGVYWAMWLIAAIALLGALRLAGSKVRSWRLTDDVVLWSTHIGLLLVVVAALVYYMVFFIRGGHGRYLFSAYPSLAIVLAAGSLAWFRLSAQRWIAASLALLNLGLATYGLFGLLIPTFAAPRTASSAEVQAATPLDANIGDTARVLGYRLDKAEVKGGDTLTVEVIWQPLSRTDTPYFIFAHLLSPNTGSITQVDTYPAAGRYPTTYWDEGRPFADAYHLTLPTDVTGITEARVVLGLYNHETMQRLPVTGADAGTPDEAWVQLGTVRIIP
jgi:hypothetical protein